MAVKVAVRETTNTLGQKVRDYKLLVKLRLSLTVVFSSVMAFMIASNGAINWSAIVILGLGGFLVTAAANALNQVLEKDFDRLMKRTADRPIAAGRMKASEAVMAAGFMCLFGVTLLALFNPWTAFFGMFALVCYAFLYTPMKRISPIAVTIGAIPGALPTLIGCVAAQGDLSLLALALFGIQFFWQFPHFWSIGWLGFEDYTKAGYKFLPTTNGKLNRSTGFQAFIYALFLIPLSLTPYLLGVSGIISAIIVVIFSLCYAYFGWKFYQESNRKSALQLMFYSFFYLPLSLIVLLIDKI